MKHGGDTVDTCRVSNKFKFKVNHLVQTKDLKENEGKDF